MSKSKLKKALALLLAVSMLATSFVACKSDDSDKDKDTDTNVTDDKDTDDDKDADDDAEPEEFTYPMSYDGENLSIFASGFMGLNSDFNTADESPFHTALEENTGLDLDWDFVPSGTDANTYKNLILSGSTFPTLITGTNVAEADTYVSDGVCIDLVPYLEDYAPNYYAALHDEANAHIKRSLTTDTGKVVGFGSWREEEFGAIWQGMMIREDLLTAQGLEMPQTIADWDEVMKVMHDEYDMQFSVEVGASTPMFSSGFGAYGTYYATKYIDDDGKVRIAQMDTAWKDYMVKMNEWYAAGYIDPDFVTIDDASLQAKIYNEDVFATQEAMSRMTLFTTYAADNNNGHVWSATPWPVLNEGDVACTGYIQDTVRTSMVSVSTSCTDEQLEPAIRFLDYFLTEDGCYFQNYGTEDTHTWNEDGTIQWADYILEDSQGMRNAIDKYVGASGISIGCQYTNLVAGINDPAAVKACFVWADNADSMAHLFPAGVSFTDDEQITISDLATSMETYIQETCIAYIQGTLDPETHFDTFLQELEDSYRLSELIEIYQTGYERFLTR